MRVPGGYNVGGVEIYSTTNEGTKWDLEFDRKDKNRNDIQYNPFIRIHPSKETIYYGGVQLYKAEKSGTTWNHQLITGVHVDMKTLEFDPKDSDTYYSLNDGGIWRCKVNAGANDTCTHRNTDLRTTLFWDADVSGDKSDLMIGGTQDNGTILYEGNLDWKGIKGGDGMYSLIAPTNDKVMYTQHQYLKDTKQSTDGGKTWLPVGTNTGLPQENKWGFYNAFITVHPKDANHIFAQGEQVLSSTDGGITWDKKGPSGTTVKGEVKRVVIQPVTGTWLAGMTKEGQIWSSSSGGGVGHWTLISSHPNKNAVVANMVFAPNNNKVLYVNYGGVKTYWRLERLEQQSDGRWQGDYINGYLSGSLPVKHAISKSDVRILSIAGDYYSDTVAYVGTDKGVFRGEKSSGSSTWTWQTYNDGLPLTEVRDIMVDPYSKELRAFTWGRGAWTTITGP